MYVRLCVWFRENLCVMDSVGMFLDVGVCIYVESKFTRIKRCSYLGQLKLRTHRKASRLCRFTVVGIVIFFPFDLKRG